MFKVKYKGHSASVGWPFLVLVPMLGTRGGTLPMLGIVEVLISFAVVLSRFHRVRGGAHPIARVRGGVRPDGSELAGGSWWLLNPRLAHVLRSDGGGTKDVNHIL